MAASERFVGCCGAYCKTCGALADGSCRGCKLGYGDGGRDITKARCRMKVCCFRENKLESCADCADYGSCRTIKEFQNKRGYKYGKYKQSLEYIREHGYKKFLEKAADWKGAYGKLD